MCSLLYPKSGFDIQVLKQKRLYENQREQLYNQQFNMEQTSFALDSIKDTAQTVQAMKAAGAELKTAFKKQDLNIDSIEKLQDEMADLMVRLSNTSPALPISSRNKQQVCCHSKSSTAKHCWLHAGHAQ